MKLGMQGPVSHHVVQVIDQACADIAVGNIILRLVITTDLIVRGWMRSKTQTALGTFKNLKKISTYRVIFHVKNKPAVIIIAYRAVFRGFGSWAHLLGIDPPAGGLFFYPDRLLVAR
jgi:hypothetical protein